MHEADVAQTSAPRSPVEAFAELARAVHEVKDQVARVSEFVQGTGADLRRNAEQYRADGAEAGAAALITVHDFLFREARVVSHASVEHSLAARALEVLRAELDMLGYVIYSPAPGDPVDLKWVRIVAAEEASDYAGSSEALVVARVLGCAYGRRLPDGGYKAVRLAEVTVSSAGN